MVVSHGVKRGILPSFPFTVILTAPDRGVPLMGESPDGESTDRGQPILRRRTCVATNLHVQYIHAV